MNEMGKLSCTCNLREEMKDETDQCEELYDLRQIQAKYLLLINKVIYGDGCPRLEEEPCRNCNHNLRY